VRAERVAAVLGLLALPCCTVALDFSPGALQPSLDGGGRDALPGVDAPVDAHASEVGADACTMGSCQGMNCPSPLVACGDQCVNLLTDARHCGVCGASCGPGAPRCCNGACSARCR
jgi:hypothetical protein